MVSSADLLDQGKVIFLGALDIEMKRAFKENKYCLIFDKSGNVGVCLKYKKHMLEVHKDIDKVLQGS